MDIYTLLLIAAGLAMDAFAVSITCGLAIKNDNRMGKLRISGSFGLFQGLMPALGYTVARTFADKITAIDHWVAFILLAFVGTKMIAETVREKEGEHDRTPDDVTRWGNVFVMAVATSIDALAVGASFAVTPKTGVLAPWFGYLICCGVIAVLTFIISLSGLALGRRFGERLGKKAEIAGGIVLIGIGVKILLEHTIIA